MPDNEELMDEALLPELFTASDDEDDYHADILLDQPTETTTKAFTEADHPRGGKGTTQGGRFVKKGSGGGATTTKDKGKGKKTVPNDKDTSDDKPVTLNADLTPYEKEAGASYNTREINKQIKEKHGKQFDVPGQTTENEKAAKRVSTKKKGAYINEQQYLLLKQKAASKIIHVANHPDHAPTKEEIQEAKEGIKEYGGAYEYRKTINGNSKDRRNRKIALAAEFGDGKRCGCVYCGVIISYSPEYSNQPMDEDKIHGTESGGKYKHQHLLPACIPCNRGDKKAKDSLEFLQSSKYGQTHLPSSPDNPNYKPPKEKE